jgi:hypothetical protein
MASTKVAEVTDSYQGPAEKPSAEKRELSIAPFMIHSTIGIREIKIDGRRIDCEDSYRSVPKIVSPDATVS